MTKKNKSPAKPLTAKQKRFIALMPKVKAGELSVEEAMRRSGYSEKTSRQQSKVMSGVRHSSAMQEALRKAGVTEAKIAQYIAKDLPKLKPGKPRLGYLQTAAELLDAFPAKKNLNADVDPEQLLNEAEKTAVVAPWGDAASDQ